MDGGFKAPKTPSPSPPAASRRRSEALPEILRVCSEVPFTQDKVDRVRVLLEGRPLRHREEHRLNCDSDVRARNYKGQTATHSLISGK